MIIGPVFFHKTVNSKCNVRMILFSFFSQVTDEEKLYGHFVQDNVTAHNEYNSMHCIR
jgi:hypothetical protein